MSTHVVTINARDSVHDALELMLENKVSALPVIDHRSRCVGILSSTDFVDVTYDLDEDLSAIEHESELWWGVLVKNLSQQVGQQSVMDLMTEDVVAVSADNLLTRAAEVMLRERVHRLPVLDGDQRLLGILSSTDILKALVAFQPTA
jgi:CBS domain-containing protein